MLPALWRGGSESPTSIVLMSKLEWRRLRLNTLSVFSLKITMVWKLYIQIIAKIRFGEKKDFYGETCFKDSVFVFCEVNYLYQMSRSHAVRGVDLTSNHL